LLLPVLKTFSVCTQYILHETVFSLFITAQSVAPTNSSPADPRTAPDTPILHPPLRGSSRDLWTVHVATTVTSQIYTIHCPDEEVYIPVINSFTAY